MIPVNFEPEATNQVLIMPYPVWTVLGLVVVVAVVAGMIIWWKSRSANPNERIYDDIKIEHKEASIDKKI